MQFLSIQFRFNHSGYSALCCSDQSPPVHTVAPINKFPKPDIFCCASRPMQPSRLPGPTIVANHSTPPATALEAMQMCSFPTLQANPRWLGR